MVKSSKVEYVQTGQLVIANYVKNSKAIGFLWGVFSVCYAVISLLIFFQPQWIGNSSLTNPGYFSPWKQCAISSIVSEEDGIPTPDFSCRGRLDDFSTIPNLAMRISTLLVGIGTIIATLSIFAMILFVCSPTAVAYYIVAWMQLISALSTSLALVVFPIGWESATVRYTCGSTAGRYSLGVCEIRWVFVLAILGLADGVVLAILGFVLGSRHVKLTATTGARQGGTASSYVRSGYYPTATDTTGVSCSIPRGTGASIVGKRTNPHPIQPIILIPPEISDYASDYGRTKASIYKAEYATPSQQFQL